MTLNQKHTCRRYHRAFNSCTTFSFNRKK